MLDLDNRLPAESGRVLNCVQLGRDAAVVDDVEPVVMLQPLGGPVLVQRQRDLADAGPPLHLDEPNLDERPGILRVPTARDQIEASIVALDALDVPAPR